MMRRRLFFAVFVNSDDQVGPEEHIPLQFDFFEGEVAAEVWITSRLVLQRLHHLDPVVLVLPDPGDSFSGLSFLSLFLIILALSIRTITPLRSLVLYGVVVG